MNVVSPCLIPSLGALPVPTTFEGTPVGVSSIGDPSVIYDRVFRNIPKGKVMWGQMFFMVIRRFHPQTLQYENHNVVVVRSRFVDKTLRFKKIT